MTDTQQILSKDVRSLSSGQRERKKEEKDEGRGVGREEDFGNVGQERKD